MMMASARFFSMISRRIVTSSIQGTGAQNLLRIVRQGCDFGSATAFGPYSRRRFFASSLVNPVDALGASRENVLHGHYYLTGSYRAWPLTSRAASRCSHSH